jgi:6-pyruvoyltetrahydropterin/6-carboxytetrahydropterin synthase
MNTVLLQQMFEFAAAHRLHADELSEQENRRVFGKCNNPNAHGHNYRVQPLVAVRLGDQGEQRFTLADLERLVEESVIDRFDHMNLNVDVEDFSETIPSVENIARVAYERLAPAIKQTTEDARLVNVTVWETDKTASTFPAEAAPLSFTPLHTANHAVSTDV